MPANPYKHCAYLPFRDLHHIDPISITQQGWFLDLSPHSVHMRAKTHSHVCALVCNGGRRGWQGITEFWSLENRLIKWRKTSPTEPYWKGKALIQNLLVNFCLKNKAYSSSLKIWLQHFSHSKQKPQSQAQNWNTSFFLQKIWGFPKNPQTPQI